VLLSENKYDDDDDDDEGSPLQPNVHWPPFEIDLLTYRASHLTTVSSRFAETRFAKIRV